MVSSIIRAIDAAPASCHPKVVVFSFFLPVSSGGVPETHYYQIKHLSPNVGIFAISYHPHLALFYPTSTKQGSKSIVNYYYYYYYY